MADQREGGIAWTDETWNVLRGCSRMSEGCRNCYAEGMAARFSGPDMPFEGLIRDGKWNGTVKLVEDRLTAPLRWKRPRRVFVTSVSDPFHDSVTDEMLDRIFAVMALAPQHTFQVLTKRPERMREYMEAVYSQDRTICRKAMDLRGSVSGAILASKSLEDGFPNIWFGVSVENQAAAEDRIPHLLTTPAAVRFLSCEPLLGPVDLTKIDVGEDTTINAVDGYGRDPYHGEPVKTHRIDWVIVGGESGPKARPMHPDWARGLRDQCAAAGVPFLFKQFGEYRPTEEGEKWVPKSLGGNGSIFTQDGQTMARVGKKAAGRMLDGRLHDQFPDEVKP